MKNTKKVDLTNYPLVKEYIDYFEQYGELLDSCCHQVIGRNNDINGNPYRLVIVYLSNGERVGFEARSSMRDRVL